MGRIRKNQNGYQAKRRTKYEQQRQKVNEKFQAIQAITAQWATKADDETDESTNQEMAGTSIKTPDQPKQGHLVGQ